MVKFHFYSSTSDSISELIPESLSSSLSNPKYPYGLHFSTHKSPSYQ